MQISPPAAISESSPAVQCPLLAWVYDRGDLSERTTPPTVPSV